MNAITPKYICKKCGNEYKSSNGLKKHISEKHGIVITLKKHKWVFGIVSTIFGSLITLSVFYFSYKPD